jgi:hypothetical protein
MKYKDRNATDLPEGKESDINYQLGAYYDMRYMKFFTRYKFVLGLSNHNDDDTILDREYEMENGGKCHRRNFVRE